MRCELPSSSLPFPCGGPAARRKSSHWHRPLKLPIHCFYTASARRPCATASPAPEHGLDNKNRCDE